ncbi:hypothetical protein HPB52_020403 [Rhipicephalus sanguineus]|uniref:Peptidase M13 N-terminal domain-containing protein n=1 Tax=Rhipicephalus sanguineus TaxID=34632 RepID=A0A9D4Q2S8_RHISA|nr:hypothetical protein HPB52_020403 [Rhipicephalus sanguineus]
MDSIKGTKGTKSETDSRNAVESDKDKSRSDSKETREAPLKSPMAVTFDEVPLDKHEPAPTPPPPAKPDRSNLVITGVAVVFVAIVFLLILIMLTRGGLERKSSVTTATCTSEHCVRVAKLLLESIAPDVNPCENFYLHICGGWKYAGSLGEVLFQKLVDDVTFLIRTVNVPATGQSPSEKAALAYKACEDIVAKNNTNLTTLLQILEEAGLYSPPGWTGSVDALNATFYLHFTWRIAAPMKFTYVRQTDQGITLRMAPSESLKAYARRRKKPGYYDDLRKDYEMFQTTFEQNKLPNLTYDDWKKIDETVIADSEDALQEANSIINFAGWNESTIQNAIRGVSRQQWASILDTYLNRSDALRFYVDSLFLFKKFMEMPHDVGNAVAQAYYRWYMAEVLTRRVYAPWIVKDFPSFDDALKYHRGYCFAIVEQSASFALLAPYVQHAFHKAVKDDIKRLLQMVRGAYNDVFAEGVEMRSGVDMLPTYTNGTGHLFDRLTLSDEKYLKESYADYEDMTSDPLQNWRRLMIGRSRTLWTRVSMGVAGVLPAEMLYYEIDGVSNDIILRPDVAVVPAYDSGAPLLLKLASLGSLMASAMAKVLYGTQETTARWHATAHCIFRKQEPGNATGGKIVVLQRVIALAVTVLAAMKATKDDEPLTLPGIPDISGMQLLFALWCYQQCGEKEGERLCNEPLKEIAVGYKWESRGGMPI